jgi:hypothetical protein
MKTITCDKCGEEIGQNNAVGTQDTGDNKFSVWNYLIANNIDFCLHCYKEACNKISDILDVKQ